MKLPKSLKQYTWAAYPAGVVLLILFSLNFFFGSQSQFLAQLAKKREQNSEKQQTLARLNTKLTALKSVNTAQMTQDLNWMAQVYPDNKPFEAVVNELRFAAQNSGSTLTGYKSSGDPSQGFSLAAQFEVPDFSSAQKLIANLQNLLPLLSVTNMTFTGTGLTANIIGGWAPASTVTVKIDEPLPDSFSAIPQLKAKLAAYQIPVSTEIENTGIANPGTFVPTTDPFGPLQVSN